MALKQAVLVLIALVLGLWAKSLLTNEDLAKQSQNPVGPLVSVR